MLTEHEIEIRVRYCETDAMGFLHHGNHVNFYEMGRTELLRARGKLSRDRGIRPVPRGCETRLQLPLAGPLRRPPSRGHACGEGFRREDRAFVPDVPRRDADCLRQQHSGLRRPRGTRPADSRIARRPDSLIPGGIPDPASAGRNSLWAALAATMPGTHFASLQRSLERIPECPVSIVVASFRQPLWLPPLP